MIKLLTVLLVLSLSGCGDTSMPSNTNVPPPAAAAEPAPAPEPVAAAPAPEPEPEAPPEPEKPAGRVECYAGAQKVIGQVYYGAPSMDANSSRFRTKPDDEDTTVWTSLPCVYSNL